MAGHVVSSTVGARAQKGEQDVFLDKAYGLLSAATEAFHSGGTAEALEYGYQAALRIAGARITSLGVRKRKRTGVSVWQKLAEVDDAGVRQAKTFSAYSAKRSRVLPGVDSDVSAHCVQKLLSDVKEFIDFAEQERGWLSVAA